MSKNVFRQRPKPRVALIGQFKENEITEFKKLFPTTMDYMVGQLFLALGMVNSYY
jgi:hypothetical protein